MSKNVARRCSLCALDWPDTKSYEICPSCLDDEGTDRCRDVEPMDADDARSLKLHLEFDRFYDEWDETHDPARLEPDPERLVPPPN